MLCASLLSLPGHDPPFVCWPLEDAAIVGGDAQPAYTAKRHAETGFMQSRVEFDVHDAVRVLALQLALLLEAACAYHHTVGRSHASVGVATTVGAYALVDEPDWLLPGFFLH